MYSMRKSCGDLPFLLTILAGGLALRLIWFAQLHGALSAIAPSGEATRVALALAEGRGFADAYFAGYGPTAHLLPLSPGAAGLWLWLFEPRSAAANFALLGWSILQVGFGYYLLARLFKHLNADPLTIRWGMAFLCLIPVFVEQETVDFRYWEGAAAICLVSANLLLLLELEARERVRDSALLAIAGLASVTFFLSPPVGLATGACWAVFALRRLSFMQLGKIAAAGGVALGLMVVPWAIRNTRDIGNPVLLRSNAGLEMALANHSAALSDRPPQEVIANRIMAIHPSLSEQARAALKDAGGEVAYSAQLGTETRQWIAEHPLGFAQLSLRHLRQFYFPEPWQMEFSQWEAFRPWRARLIALVNLFGLVALGVGLWSRRRGYGVLALYLGVVALPYMVVQPTPRYSYLVFGLLSFLAIEGLVRIGRKLAVSTKRETTRPFRTLKSNVR
jgi:hypothetical protein